MAKQALATVLTDAMRDTKTVLQDSILKNVQSSEVL